MVSEIHRKSSISCICMCKYKYKILYAIYDITHNFILKPRNMLHFFFAQAFSTVIGKGKLPSISSSTSFNGRFCSLSFN